MPTYEMRAPNGKLYRIDGPKGATDDQIRAQIMAQYPDAGGKPAARGGARPAARPADPTGGKRGKGGFAETLDAGVRGALSGALFNFDDNVVAALNTVLPLDRINNKNVTSVWQQSGSLGDRFSKAYNQNLKTERAIDRYDEQNNPGARLTGQVGGSLATLAIPGSAPARLVQGSKAANTVRTAVQGSKAATKATNAGARVLANPVANAAAQGALAGAGAGEGDASNIFDSATTGAITGAAFGGAFAALGKAAPLAKQYYDAFRGKGSEDEALRQITAALKKDGFDVSGEEGQKALRAAIAEFGDKPASLADVGSNTRSRTGVALRSSSDAQNAGIATVEGRLANAEGRLKGDVYANVAPSSDVFGEANALVQQRRAAAGPAYEQAYTSPFQVNDEINAILDTPAGKEGLNFARRLAAQERRDPNKLGLIEVPSPVGGLMETKITTPTLETMDYVQRAMRAEVAKNTVKDAFGRETVNDWGRVVQNSLNDLNKQIEALSPEFGAARQQYRGTSELLNALEQGKKFNSLAPEQVSAKVGALSEPAQDMFRIGAARSLIDDLGNTLNQGTTPASAANRILRNTNEIDRLAATGANADGLLAATKQERTLADLNKELRGSSTDQRQGARIGALADIPTGAIGWAREIIGYVGQAKNLERNEAINNVLLPKLLEQDKTVINQTIDELVKQGKKGEKAANYIRNAVRAATRATTPTVGEAVAVRNNPILLEE